MYELKTKPGSMTPEEIIEAIPDEKRRQEAEILLGLFIKATGQSPVVWGQKYIGFGSYRYTYQSGHQGEIYKTGFAITKNKITFHLYMDEKQRDRYLEKLGKVKTGKSCLYINHLEDVDEGILTEIIKNGYAYVTQMYG